MFRSRWLRKSALALTGAAAAVPVMGMFAKEAPLPELPFEIPADLFDETLPFSIRDQAQGEVTFNIFRKVIELCNAFGVDQRLSADVFEVLLKRAEALSNPVNRLPPITSNAELIDAIINAGDDFVVVKFHHSGCPHCFGLSGMYRKAAEVCGAVPITRPPSAAGPDADAKPGKEGDAGKAGGKGKAAGGMTPTPATPGGARWRFYDVDTDVTPKDGLPLADLELVDGTPHVKVYHRGAVVAKVEATSYGVLMEKLAAIATATKTGDPKPKPDFEETLAKFEGIITAKAT